VGQVYSERLYLGHGITTESFAPPAGNVWVVKMITVFVSGTYAGQAQLIDDDTDATIFWQGVIGAGTSSYYIFNQLHLVIPSEQVTHWNNNPGAGPGTFDVGLFGYALTLP
jgi:hypothetical protein